MRHLWSRIASDLVHMSLPQSASSVVLSYDDIAEAYKLTIQELYILSELEDFKKIIEIERDRVRQLGHRAGFLVRTEAIATELIEVLYERVCRSELTVDVKDIIKAVELMTKVSGLSAEKDQSGSHGPAVAIQFNMPELSNSKLNHINIERVGTIDPI